MHIEDAAGTSASEQGPDSKGFYADDVPFTSGIVQGQSPLRMAYSAALNGFNPPRPQGHFRYCDMGCGNGMTINAYASLYPEAEFVGIDFNAGHIQQAREQAARLNLNNITFIHGSFADIEPRDLPTFDFIGMNGIYSWLDWDIVPSVQSFVANNLRVGGLFYVEFMTMPGMISVVPMWQLMQALVPDRGDGSHQRATRALRLLEELKGAGMSYLDRHPAAQAAVNRYTSDWKTNEARIDHFAHNALPSGFRPRFFNEMVAEMETAGLTFAGRTESALNDPDLAATLQQATLLKGIEDRTVRELLLDFMRNERSRRDVFIKEVHPDPEGAKRFLLDEIAFIARAPSPIPTPQLSLPGPRTEKLEGALYDRMKQAFEGQASTPRQAIGDDQVSDEILLAASHRMEVSGAFFLCDGDFTGGPLEAAPEVFSIPLAVNQEQIDKGARECIGMPLVSPHVGGTVMSMSPLEAVLLYMWFHHGKDAAVEQAMADLAKREGTVMLNKQRVKLSDVPQSHIETLLTRLENIRVPNLVRMGVLKCEAAAGSE